jgi:hypothetical protein
MKAVGRFSVLSLSLRSAVWRHHFASHFASLASSLNVLAGANSDKDLHGQATRLKVMTNHHAGVRDDRAPCSCTSLTAKWN